MKTKDHYRRILVCFCMMSAFIMLIGCAGQRTQIVTDSGVRLSTYKTILVEFTSKAPDSDSELDQIEAMVVSKLKREQIFEKILSASGNPDAQTDLTLKADLIELVKVSDGARIIGGALAGRARATMDVKLFENSTGRLLSQFKAEGKTGAWALAGTTDQAIALTAKEIVETMKKIY